MSYYGADFEGLWFFEIQASLAPKESKDGTRSYRENVTLQVVSTGANRAIELFIAEYPGAELHKVERRNRTKGVIVDPVAIGIEAPIEPDASRRYTLSTEECEVCGCRYVCGYSKAIGADGAPIGLRHQIDKGTLPVRTLPVPEEVADPAVADADALKVAVCEALLSVNADDPAHPFIPPTAIDWIGDRIVGSIVAAR